MKFILNGNTSKETALELGLSPRTVHSALENIYFKLGVSGNGARHKACLIVKENSLLD